MTTEQASAQAYKPDMRNEQVQVYVNGAFFPRDKAVVSVFDAGFALGDGVWEGLRLVKGKLISLDAHMDRHQIKDLYLEGELKRLQYAMGRMR